MRIVDMRSCSHLIEVEATARDGLPKGCAVRRCSLHARPEWACSSVVEHCVDIAGVASSILATPTMRFARPVSDLGGLFFQVSNGLISDSARSGPRIVLIRCRLSAAAAPMPISTVPNLRCRRVDPSASLKSQAFEARGAADPDPGTCHCRRRARGTAMDARGRRRKCREFLDVARPHDGIGNDGRDLRGVQGQGHLFRSPVFTYRLKRHVIVAGAWAWRFGRNRWLVIYLFHRGFQRSHRSLHPVRGR